MSGGRLRIRLEDFVEADERGPDCVPAAPTYKLVGTFPL